MNIRPVSDLRNNYTDIERDVAENGPVFLTKNGRGSMVVMSFRAVINEQVRPWKTPLTPPTGRPEA